MAQIKRSAAVQLPPALGTAREQITNVNLLQSGAELLVVIFLSVPEQD